MRNEQEATRAIEQYGDMIRRICFLHLKNYSDTEDIFQSVFLKYILCSDVFESVEHEKAWFIRVSVNACKDLLKSFYRKKTVPLDFIADSGFELSEDNGEVLKAVLELPTKYKDMIYLFYFEEYRTSEIAKMLKKNENTVYTLLSRGREILKNRLGGEWRE